MCNAVVLTIDIVLHMLGDLSNPGSLKLWIDMILAGIVILTPGGPPCETWSAVKALQLYDKDGSPRKGPRPLRDDDSFWGLECLNRQKRKSVDLGNALVRAMTTLFYASARTCNSACIMEHPAQPRNINPPSSWKLPELMFIAEHPLMFLCGLIDAPLKHPAKKPTTLLCLNIPYLRRVGDSKYGGGRCTHSTHAIVLQGTDEQGNFLPAPAKQYPTLLNNCLAEASHRYICSATNPANDLDSYEFLQSQLATLYVSLDPYLEQHHLGHFG